MRQKYGKHFKGFSPEKQKAKKATRKKVLVVRVTEMTFGLIGREANLAQCSMGTWVNNILEAAVSGLPELEPEVPISQSYLIGNKLGPGTMCCYKNIQITLREAAAQMGVSFVWLHKKLEAGEVFADLVKRCEKT